MRSISKILLWLSPEPLLPPRLWRRQQRLNPEVEYSAYPCCALLQAQRWIIPFGARNQYCCLVTLAATTSAALPAFMK